MVATLFGTIADALGPRRNQPLSIWHEDALTTEDQLPVCHMPVVPPPPLSTAVLLKATRVVLKHVSVVGQ